MIARVWRGRSTIAQADGYERHAKEMVFPSLRGIPGHRGAYLLRRETDGGIEFLVLTLWDSIEAVRGFAGEDVESAVVEPQARAVLEDFDRFVRHFDVVHGPDL